MSYTKGKKQRQATRKVSKRAKGFPIKMTTNHILSLHQVYAWLDAEGHVDEAMAEAYEKTIPKIKLTDAEIYEGKRTGEIQRLEWANGWGRTKTIRVRGQHIGGIVDLFRLVGPLIGYGQTGYTFTKRANDLDGISATDRMMDATLDE